MSRMGQNSAKTVSGKSDKQELGKAGEMSSRCKAEFKISTPKLCLTAAKADLK